MLALWVADAATFESFSSNACTQKPVPPSLSYHIHVLFMAASADSTARALALRTRFMETFDLLQTPNCTFEAGDPQPQRTDMCPYEIDWDPAGPFPTAQYSFFVPKAHFGPTVRWIMNHRDSLDVLVHPNSGCEVEDHVVWPLWGGQRWPLDAGIFSCEFPGCVVNSSDV